MGILAEIIGSEEARQEIRGERLAQLAGQLWGSGLCSLPLTVKAVILTKTESGWDWDYEYGEPKQLPTFPAGFSLGGH